MTDGREIWLQASSYKLQVLTHAHFRFSAINEINI